jgi:hypothetical protein
VNGFRLTDAASDPAPSMKAGEALCGNRVRVPRHSHEKPRKAVAGRKEMLLAFSVKKQAGKENAAKEDDVEAASGSRHRTAAPQPR